MNQRVLRVSIAVPPRRVRLILFLAVDPRERSPGFCTIPLGLFPDLALLRLQIQPFSTLNMSCHSQLYEYEASYTVNIYVS